jgi:hypothetical protein
MTITVLNVAMSKRIAFAGGVGESGDNLPVICAQSLTLILPNIVYFTFVE